MVSNEGLHLNGTSAVNYIPVNGHTSLSNGNVNGHVNGPVNGHTNGHINVNHVNGNVGGTKRLPGPIAICGLSMRLPGGIHDAESFWDVLYHGKDMRELIPEDRYNAKGFNDALGKKGAIKTQYGYFLKDDLACLDTSFFTMTKAELDKLDPQNRQILEVTRDCLENAGELNYRGKTIGCYVGTFGEDWLQSLSKESQHHGGYALSGDLMIANRVSYEYDFKGPRYINGVSLVGVLLPILTVS